MNPREGSEVAQARSATREEISALIYEKNEAVLIALLQNPHFDESHLTLLLERKDLSPTLLEEIARRRDWLRRYQVKRRLAFHPHTPRLAALRLGRQLYLMDQVHLSLLSSTAAEVRRLAEDLILSRLPQLPLGQKITLARRASARVAGALLGEGHERVVPLALDNAFLTEAQVLRVLARDNLPETVIGAIAGHSRWSHHATVRMALARHPQVPLACVLAFLPEMTPRELEELCALTTVSENLRRYIRHEIARRASIEPSRSSGGEYIA